MRTNELDEPEIKVKIYQHLTTCSIKQGDFIRSLVATELKEYVHSKEYIQNMLIEYEYRILAMRRELLRRGVNSELRMLNHIKNDYSFDNLTSGIDEEVISPRVTCGTSLPNCI